MSAFTGGAAITAKLVDDDAAVEFLWLGGVWLVVGVIGLILLRSAARKRAIAHQLFIALFANVGLTPMLFALALPLLWGYGPFSVVGGTLIAYFILMLGYQLREAHKHFVECWAKNHQKILELFYNPRAGSIYVEPLLVQLQIQADLFLPVRSEALKGLLSLALILSMIIGFNLRNLYPDFSAFAWGIPALTLSTVCVQIGFLRVQLVLKLRELEKRSGMTITPMGDDEVMRVKARQKKSKP